MAGLASGWFPPPPRGWMYTRRPGKLTQPPPPAGSTPSPIVMTPGTTPPPLVTPPPGVTPPPVAPPQAPLPPLKFPTFQPVQTTTDPKITALIAALTKQLTGAGQATRGFQQQLTAAPSPEMTARSVERPQMVSDAQRQALEQRILALLSGQGPDIGDISTDPEARAYRLARTRESERQRQEEAESLAASGLSGSGDFESRRFQIGEGRAEDIAGFEAGLSGRRRQQMIDTSLQAAGLSLQDLSRQAALEESRGMVGERAEDRRLMAALQAARLRQSGATSAGQLALGSLGTQIQGTQGLLGILGQESARKDQIALQNQQLGAEISFRQAQLQQAQQDLMLRRDQFRSDAGMPQAQLALQQQMADLQRLREELERQLLEEQLRRERREYRDKYGRGLNFGVGPDLGSPGASVSTGGGLPGYGL